VKIDHLRTHQRATLIHRLPAGLFVLWESSSFL